MQLNKKQILILYHLLLTGGYTSSHRLSVLTGLSRRSVQSEISQVKKYCDKNGVRLLSSSSKGFMLDRNTLNDQFIHHVFSLRIDASEDDVTYENYRRNSIMNELIRQKDYIRERDLAEKLFISESAIAKEMIKCRVRLKKYNLELVSKPYYGLKVIGSEIDKRRELSNFYMTHLKMNDAIYDFMDTFIDRPNSFQNRIYTLLLEHHLSFTDFQICDFFIILAVTIERINEGFEIEEDIDIAYGKNKITQMMPIAGRIAEWVKEGYGCEFNEHELRMLAIELICRSTLSEEGQKCSDEYLIACREILDEIYYETHIQLNNSSFINRLAIEAESLVFRNHYLERNRTPLYRNAPDMFPLAHQLANRILSKLGQRYEAIESRSELFHLAVMIDAEIYKAADKIKVLLLSSYDHSYTEAIRNKLQYNFYYDLNIVDTCSYYEFVQKDLTEFDMVISTFQFHRNTLIPCLMITPKCTDEDIEILRYSLDSGYYKKKLQFYFLPDLYHQNINVVNTGELSSLICEIIKNNFSGLNHITADSISRYIDSIEMFNVIGLIRLPISLGNEPVAFTIVLKNNISAGENSLRIAIVYFARNEKTNLPDLMQIQLKKMAERTDRLQFFIDNPNYYEFMDILIDS